MDEDSIEEEYELPTETDAMSAPLSQPDEEVDEVLQREEAELAELMAFMPDVERPADDSGPGQGDFDWPDTHDPNQSAWDDLNDASQNAWSDDDGYEALFSEFAAQSDSAVHSEEAMDLS